MSAAIQERAPPGRGLLVLAMIAVAVMAGAMVVAAVTPRLPGRGVGAGPQDLYVTREVRVRDAPTAEGSSIVDTLVRGAPVRGMWVDGADGVTPWLRVETPGRPDRYVWGKNLSPFPRPDLEAALDEERVVVTASGIRAEVDQPEGEQVAAGDTVRVVGAVAGGLMEIALRAGGVGYIASSAFEPVYDAAAMAIQGPSFDCGAASRWAEHRICADEALSSADLRIAELYAKAQDMPQSYAASDQRQTAQRAWIDERDTCEQANDPAGCLTALYQRREQELVSETGG